MKFISSADNAACELTYCILELKGYLDEAVSTLNITSAIIYGSVHISHKQLSAEWMRGIVMMIIKILITRHLKHIRCVFILYVFNIIFEYYGRIGLKKSMFVAAVVLTNLCFQPYRGGTPYMDYIQIICPKGAPFFCPQARGMTFSGQMQEEWLETYVVLGMWKMEEFPTFSICENVRVRELGNLVKASPYEDVQNT